MPGREIPFLNEGIYHVFTKTADRRNVFTDGSLRFLFLDLLRYYRSSKSILRHSNYMNLAEEIKAGYDKQIAIEKHFLVAILCFSVMPTHFHLLLQQKMDGGVSHFISQILNSLTRFYNIKYERKGSIFLNPFKAVQVLSDEQCKHVSRYIHLNENSSGLLKDTEEVFISPNSSMPRYLNDKDDDLIDKKFISNLFDKNIMRYKKFISDNVDYQKSLERLKYTEKWI